MDKLMDLLKLAFRQKEAVYRVGRLFSAAFEGGFSPKKLLAVIVEKGRVFLL